MGGGENQSPILDLRWKDMMGKSGKKRNEKKSQDETVSQMSSTNKYLLIKNVDFFVLSYVTKFDYDSEFTADKVYQGYIGIGGDSDNKDRVMKQIVSALEKIASEGGFDLKKTTGGYIRHK